LRCRRPVVLNEAHHISKSYPAFFQDLQKLGTRMEWA
jgi:3-phosphoshikimate 1-carboxyvinyltransferase